MADRLSPVGVYYCTAHDGVMNEDDQRCDFVRREADHCDGSDDGNHIECAESACTRHRLHMVASPSTPTRRGKTLVKGHTLRSEGGTYERGARGWRLSGAAVGVGLCSCGATSPVLTSDRQRKRWHAEHKQEVAGA